VRDSKLRTGVLYGVGIGPGDPELLTLKAVRILKQVEVIAVPKSKEEAESKALSIVQQAVDIKGKEILELVLPMTKEKEILAKAREDVVNLICEKLKQGMDIACITLGDPLFYSTFSYFIPLITKVLPEIEVRVIPGVTSINAVSSITLLPLAEADEKVAVIPATYEEKGLKEIIRNFDSIVLMKINKVMDKILTILEELDLKDKAVFISRAGWPDEVVVKDVESLRNKRLDYFSMIMIKK